jgi:hypothetical protein
MNVDTVQQVGFEHKIRHNIIRRQRYGKYDEHLVYYTDQEKSDERGRAVSHGSNERVNDANR